MEYGIRCWHTGCFSPGSNVYNSNTSNDCLVDHKKINQFVNKKTTWVYVNSPERVHSSFSSVAFTGKGEKKI
ncbi:hypothetical protein ACF0H5_011797 [Mactra antiquata]